ncbi:MAG: 30S ribosomal protein S9, partial [Opitutaceae bacterium]
MSATPANVHLGTGRRKTSTARVRITEGSGKLTVNGRTFEDYFSHDNFAKQAYAPLLTVELKDKIDGSVNVSGGGVAGQAGAVAHGIARALQKLN